MDSEPRAVRQSTCGACAEELFLVYQSKQSPLSSSNSLSVIEVSYEHTDLLSIKTIMTITVEPQTSNSKYYILALEHESYLKLLHKVLL